MNRSHLSNDSNGLAEVAGSLKEGMATKNEHAQTHKSQGTETIILKAASVGQGLNIFAVV